MDGSERIAFPPTGSDFGHVTHIIVSNPSWRWWSFWRPRTLMLEVLPAIRIKGERVTLDVADVTITRL